MFYGKWNVLGIDASAFDIAWRLTPSLCAIVDWLSPLFVSASTCFFDLIVLHPPSSGLGYVVLLCLLAVLSELVNRYGSSRPLEGRRRRRVVWLASHIDARVD